MSLDTFGDLNWLAVLVAAVAFFVWGAIYYSPVLMANQYRAAVGVEVDPAGRNRPPAKMLALTFVGWFVASAAIAFFAKATGADGIGQGIDLGFVAALLAISTKGVAYMYEQRTPALWVITAIHDLVGFMIVAIIVVAWK